MRHKVGSIKYFLQQVYYRTTIIYIYTTNKPIHSYTRNATDLKSMTINKMLPLKWITLFEYSYKRNHRSDLNTVFMEPKIPKRKINCFELLSKGPGTTPAYKEALSRNSAYSDQHSSSVKFHE